MEWFINKMKMSGSCVVFVKVHSMEEVTIQGTDWGLELL